MAARRQWLTTALGLTLLVLALRGIGQASPLRGAAPLGLVWWPTGGLVAAFVAYGTSVALLSLALDFFVQLTVAAGAEQAALGACLDALPAMAVAVGLRRLGLRPSLTRLVDVMLLACGAVGIAAMAGGLFGWRYAHGSGAWMHRACLSVALAHAASVLLVAPAALVWWPKRRRLRLHAPQLLEVAVLLGGLAFVAVQLAPLRSRSPLADAPAAAFVFLPTFLWAATRYGQRGAISALAAVGALALALRWASDYSHPPSALAASTYGQAPLAVQLYLCVALFCVLVFGSVIEERKEAIRLRDDFLLIASHELKTPLTALMLGVENLERRMQREDGVTAQAYRKKLTSCHAQIDRLARLVDGLLDVSRISGRNLRLRFEHQNLAALVQIALGQMKAMAEQTRCTFVATLAPDAWGLFDQQRVLQLLQVLLENACKYGAGKPVHVQLEVGAEDLQVVVQDEGIGVSPEDAKRIFRRFERAVSTHSYGGLGLGLFVAHKIAAAHGGELRVDVAAKAGARFVIRLPRRRSAVARWLDAGHRLPEWLRPQPE